ncbi:MAG: hypothetical protein H8E12_09090 [Rhodobacteraceae bacterium]|nr:hypothetical protein [Paracoccaceae bacterium]
MYVQKTDLSEILNNIGDKTAVRFVELQKRREILITAAENSRYSDDIREELNKVTDEIYEIRQLAGLVSSR